MTPADQHINPALLDQLLLSTHPITLDTLASGFSSTQQEVSCALDSLANAECRMDTHPARGVTILEAGLACWEDYLRWKLKYQPTRTIQVYRQTASTQDAVRKLTESNPTQHHDAIVIADEQTSARGRLGRRWITPPGAALAFSRAHKLPKGQDLASQANWLTLATVVAITKAIEAVTPLRSPTLAIKWPNDVLLHGKKLAGILVETFEPCLATNESIAIIGVGINTSLNPTNSSDALPSHSVTSLADQGYPIDRLVLLTQALRQLDEVFQHPDPTYIADQWHARCPTGSKSMTFKHAGQKITGRVVDLDPWQGLIVRTTTGEMVHLPASTTTVIDS